MAAVHSILLDFSINSENDLVAKEKVVEDILGVVFPLEQR